MSYEADALERGPPYHQSPSKPTNPATNSLANHQYRKPSDLTCKQEDGKISFPLDGATPIPGARQTSVDATTCIVKVVRSRAVESMPEEVRENFFDETIDRTELLFDESVNAWVILEAWDLAKGGGDGKQDAVDLRVLVDEHQSVRDIMVTFRYLGNSLVAEGR